MLPSGLVVMTDAMGGLSLAAQEPAQPVAQEAYGELDPERAISTAKAALGYTRAFDGKGINWQNDEPWPHRIELAQALDWITDLGAMVMNLASRVAAPPAPAAPDVVQNIVKLAVKWYDTGNGKDLAAHELAMAVLAYKSAASGAAPVKGDAHE